MEIEKKKSSNVNEDLNNIAESCDYLGKRSENQKYIEEGDLQGISTEALVSFPKKILFAPDGVQISAEANQKKKSKRATYKFAPLSEYFDTDGCEASNYTIFIDEQNGPYSKLFLQSKKAAGKKKPLTQELQLLGSLHADSNYFVLTVTPYTQKKLKSEGVKLSGSQSLESAKAEFNDVIQSLTNQNFVEEFIEFPKNLWVDTLEFKEELEFSLLNFEGLKEVGQFVQEIFDLESIEKNILEEGVDLEKYLKSYDTEKIWRANFFLDTISSILVSNKYDPLSKVKLQELSSKFYGQIPHNFGFLDVNKYNIESLADVEEKKQLLLSLRVWSVVRERVGQTKSCTLYNDEKIIDFLISLLNYNLISLRKNECEELYQTIGDNLRQGLAGSRFDFDIDNEDATKASTSENGTANMQSAQDPFKIGSILQVEKKNSNNKNYDKELLLWLGKRKTQVPQFLLENPIFDDDFIEDPSMNPSNVCRFPEEIFDEDKIAKQSLKNSNPSKDELNNQIISSKQYAHLPFSLGTYLYDVPSLGINQYNLDLNSNQEYLFLASIPYESKEKQDDEKSENNVHNPLNFKTFHSLKEYQNFEEAIKKDNQTNKNIENFKIQGRYEFEGIKELHISNNEDNQKEVTLLMNQGKLIPIEKSNLTNKNSKIIDENEEISLKENTNGKESKDFCSFSPDTIPDFNFSQYVWRSKTTKPTLRYIIKIQYSSVI